MFAPLRASSGTRSLLEANLSRITESPSGKAYNMRFPNPLFCFVTFAALMGSALAQSPSKQSNPVQGSKAPPSTVGTKKPIRADLTENECSNLGGTTTTLVGANLAGICKSGKVCETVDESNQKHQVCISAAQ